MADPVYRLLRNIAIVLTLAWLGWSLYDSFFSAKHPGDIAYHAGNKLFEDGQYERALQEYENTLQEAPEHLHAMRGKARALMQLGKYEEALNTFNTVIAKDPEFAASYANRGILYDRLGRYEKAIQDYEHAVKLDNEISEGPNWLTRFLRLQTEKPPTIADRTRYLREQLAKPPAERVLKMPEIDEKQRPYNM